MTLNENNENEAEENENLDEPVTDRNTRIERQASMHFASRIVSSKIKSGYLGESVESEEELDRKIEEELNKWMSKFHRGVHTGKVV